MAKYNSSNDLQYSSDSVFSRIYEPGNYAPYGGVYKWTGCGHEIGIAQHYTFPSQSHAQHGLYSGAIRWKAVAVHF